MIYTRISGLARITIHVRYTVKAIITFTNKLNFSTLL